MNKLYLIISVVLCICLCPCLETITHVSTISKANKPPLNLKVIPPFPIYKSVFDDSLNTRSITDSKFIFIFRENAPLRFFLEIGMNGLSWTGYIYLRSLFGLCYACFVCLGSRRFILCRTLLLCTAYVRSVKRSRRLRHYLARYKNMLLLQVVTSPILLCLLLCGDIHPNPGPVLPRSSRHPDSQLLIAGSSGYSEVSNLDLEIEVHI